MKIEQLTHLWLVEPKHQRLDDITLRLVKPLKFRIDGRVIAVPTGYRTDFGSIPAAIRGLIDPRAGRAMYVLHDWGYTRIDDPDDRLWWDTLLYEMAEPLGPITQRAIYTGVRLGGSHAWAQSG